MLGVRLSSERFGIKLGESKQLAEELMVSNKLDFLDMSLWDSFKEPQEEEFKGKSLLQHFAELKKGNTRLVLRAISELHKMQLVLWKKISIG